MKRLTKRNFLGMAYVPGYAPRTRDVPTCELIVKLTNRLAELEDLLESVEDTLYTSLEPQELTCIAEVLEAKKLTKEGLLCKQT